MPLLLTLLACLVSVDAAAADRVRGLVLDATGAPLAGASLAIAGPVVREAATGADGTFELAGLPAGSYRVSVSLDGFATWRETLEVGADGRAGDLRIVLLPRPVSATVVVTASRGAPRAADPAAPVSTLSSADLALAASPALDDALRATPGFSLFRRTSSRTANPTTQGATLRGLAASGASRALVLADGVPLNDPFGGWVYWNRVPRAAIDRVEVVRGGASDLYGADALGGVVQILTVSPSARAVRVLLDGDTHATARISTLAAARNGAWHGAASGEASRTDGVFVVGQDTRGAVDRRAGSDYLSGQVSGGVERAGGWRVGARAGAFGESRENGTAVQVNDTSVRQIAVDGAGPLGRGFLETSLHAGDQVYHQTFSSVAASRMTETLTSRQAVPASVAGGGLAYRLPIGHADLLAGADLRQITATNEDTAYQPNGSVRSVTRTPGFERTTGVYAQLRAPLGGRTTIVAGLRTDDWQPVRGGDGGRTVTSPRVSVSFRVSPALTLRASAGRAFRAPTLNERIRPFRVGNVVTLANPALAPERVTLGEAGLALAAGRGSLRLTAFSSVVDDAVTNVTITSTPQLITRQRQNVGSVSATGVEAEGDWQLAPTLWATGSTALTRSRYRDTPGLTANDVPQVPRWQATTGLRWLAPGRFTVQGLVRAFGDQYEDDRNTLVLRRAALVDLTAARALARTTSLVVALENLFDEDYDTGRTPTRTIGTPRTVRVGVRFTY